MSTKITYETQYESKSYYQPFKFLGNVHGKVKKLREYLGDGDIGTTDKGITQTSLTANLSFNASTNKVRLTVRYAVWENSFKVTDTKGNKDYLYFDAVQEYDVSEFVRAGRRTWVEKNGSVKKEATPTASLSGKYDEFYLIEYFRNKRHGWCTPETKWGDSIKQNRLSPWVVFSDIRMKIDDSGSELTKQGNIGVTGYIRFTIRRTDSIKVTTTIDDITSGMLYPVTRGNETKIASFPSVVDAVLCRGYDICGRYADSDYTKERVLDYRKLNEYQRIQRNTDSDNDSVTFSGEGVEEYTSSIEKKLSVKVSASAFGATFSHETKTSFKKDTFSKTGYKFVTQKDVYTKEKYQVQGATSPHRLTGFLTPLFLDDLNKLSADSIIAKYGTHVVLGMKVGGRLLYNMSYRESTSKLSTASTFESTTSISYNSNGSVKKDKSNNPESKAEKVYNDLTKGNISPEQLTAYAKYLEAAKNATPQTATGNGQGSNGGWGFLGDVSYSESTVNTSLREDKSTSITCYGKGGSASLLSLITRSNDLQYLAKWLDSIDANPAFADFVPGHLVPIYELVPAGYRVSAQALKDASERYQIDHGFRMDNPIRGTKRVSFSTLGNKSNTQRIADDWEISSQSGKKIYWYVRVELVNYDDGHCGYAVSFTVKEGGRLGLDTIIMSHAEGVLMADPRCSTMAIDTSRLNNKNVFEAESEWVGKYHGWQEATNYVKNNGTAKMVIDCDGAKVEVYLDGKGDDWDHVGIKGTLVIPWIGY